MHRLLTRIKGKVSKGTFKGRRKAHSRIIRRPLDETSRYGGNDYTTTLIHLLFFLYPSLFHLSTFFRSPAARHLHYENLSDRVNLLAVRSASINSREEDRPRGIRSTAKSSILCRRRLCVARAMSRKRGEW